MVLGLTLLYIYDIIYIYYRYDTCTAGNCTHVQALELEASSSTDLPSSSLQTKARSNVTLTTHTPVCMQILLGVYVCIQLSKGQVAAFLLSPNLLIARSTSSNFSTLQSCRRRGERRTCARRSPVLVCRPEHCIYRRVLII